MDLKSLILNVALTGLIHVFFLFTAVQWCIFFSPHTVFPNKLKAVAVFILLNVFKPCLYRSEKINISPWDNKTEHWLSSWSEMFLETQLYYLFEIPFCCALWECRPEAAWKNCIGLWASITPASCNHSLFYLLSHLFFFCLSYDSQRQNIDPCFVDVKDMAMQQQKFPCTRRLNAAQTAWGDSC